MPRHSPYALFRLNSFLLFSQDLLFCLSSQIIVWVVNLTCLHCFLYVAISGSIVVFPLFRKDLLVLTFANLKNLSIYNYLCFFLLFLIRFSMNICLHTVSSTSTLVGSSGLEPPTHNCLCARSFSFDFRLVPLPQHAGGLKWTRTTDLPLIRRVL